MSCLFLDAMPQTAMLQEYCVQRFAEEIRNAEHTIENPTPDVYVFTANKPFKKSIAWKIVATFHVVEFDDIALLLHKFEMHDTNSDHVKPALDMNFEYNNDPKSLKHEWGQMTKLKVERCVTPIWLLYALASLQDAWLHNLVYKRANRRMISSRPRHQNLRPKYIHDVEPFIRAIKREADLKI